MAITDDHDPSLDTETHNFVFDEWDINVQRQDKGGYFVQTMWRGADYWDWDSHDHPTVTDAVQAAIAYILED